jgi:hypothetical protein
MKINVMSWFLKFEYFLVLGLWYLVIAPIFGVIFHSGLPASTPKDEHKTNALVFEIFLVPGVWYLVIPPIFVRCARKTVLYLNNLSIFGRSPH